MCGVGTVCVSIVTSRKGWPCWRQMNSLCLFCLCHCAFCFLWPCQIWSLDQSCQKSYLFLHRTQKISSEPFIWTSKIFQYLRRNSRMYLLIPMYYKPQMNFSVGKYVPIPMYFMPCRNFSDKTYVAIVANYLCVIIQLILVNHTNIQHTIPTWWPFSSLVIVLNLLHSTLR